jgi:large subunit ribosomal protein L17
MRHRRRVKHFSRKPTARKALWRSLIVALVEHGRIATTVDKAKELRRHIERAITVGKREGLATRRLLLSRVPNEDVVEGIVSDLSVRFKDRKGGYTRIIKIGRRPGDQSEMAFIEFVDYNFEKPYKFGFVKEAKSEVVASDKAAKKTTAAKKKVSVGALVAKKKSVKKQQKKSRKSERA